MRDITAVVVRFGQGNAIQSFSNRTDLVELDENRVCDLAANGFLKNGRVGAKQVIPDYFQTRPEFGGDLFPTAPVLLA